MTAASEPTSADPAPPEPPTVSSRAGAIREKLLAVLHRRATWVLVDQGVVSAGNFLTANLLGRALPKAEYGVFGVLLETMLYLNSLQAALVIYPLTIKGATGERSALGRLSTASILLTLCLLPILGGATWASVGALSGGKFAAAAVAALVLWQLQETLRRALISDLRYFDAVWGDAVSYLGQASLVFILAYSHSLTLNRTFLIMGVTSAAAIGVQSLQIGLARVRFWQLKLIARDFWRLGRWMLLANGGGLISSLGYWWTLQWTHGPEQCAAYLAIAVLFKLANPIMSSMSGLITPAVARASSQAGTKAATRVAVRYTAFGAALLLPYFLLLALIPATLLKLAYGQKYIGEAQLLRLFVANYTVVYISSQISAWLSGLGRSRYNFYVQLFTIFGSLLVGLPMTIKWGVAGLMIGGLISSGLGAAAAAYFIHKFAITAHPHEPEPPPAVA